LLNKIENQIKKEKRPTINKVAVVCAHMVDGGPLFQIKKITRTKHAIRHAIKTL